ncbi:glyoxylase-like metal-dependent hydrolase (beta-lactamase superfamily II)/rhodanese-related sulfurtransferase [Pseudarthrobacter oxydans]|uniref:Glyoxylase-like metal-dependent hydrolase (Beta-lactamase superfamily II)/rhodanese-related sulfurtransferase n=1 Tax=Pseudarthrobacter oxydans TaxID=1671 RepID=A0AAW8NGL9_PSEOX|nr:MBL fold metallo-hydrolase [Pseudarthrobacter oxydans]MDR6793643.1 glyoxylase-like metal-dependent hydrolase (beta-lactamase superfamily II)/rhodanese-related sulfurtransferase [Pseudarthrobacter oxydans]MDR7165033.1 glyoxylase-like metal-dependent hydrolase (beta-lactamase superfamily II)/rhodanese-related sulfurtransferase [Pseudarthrobacter oxydans]
MEVITIETPQLGDRTYLVHDGAVGVVIDPQRDTDRVEKAVSDAGVTITHVAETHIHNDYVTGGLQLAQDHNAAYLVNAADDVPYSRQPISDGDTVQVGRMVLKAVATPGHTHHHLSYIVTDGDRQAVFSGGSLLYGSVGRTDLVSPEDTVPLTHHQYRSVRRLVDEAGGDAGLYPTHGFGSFCSSGPASGAESSTIGEQLSGNHALTDPDEDHFVRELIHNLTAYPSYYAHMAPINMAGPTAPDLDLPDSLDQDELVSRLERGEWVVDLRNRVAFANIHLSGSVSFEYGDGTQFTAFLGWVLPWDEQLTLVGARQDVENAIRDLSRIGIDSPDAAIGAGPADLAPGAATSSYDSVGWQEVLQKPEDDPIIDVRRTDEFAKSHIQDAVNIPLHELLRRLDKVPAGRLWVHCGSGYRSAVAASLLQRAGRDVVHIDASFRDAKKAGFTMA